jgi:ABC-type transporter Mla subunit MlaD
LDNKKYRFWGMMGALLIFLSIAGYYYIRNTPFMKRSLLLTAEFESISSLRPGSKVYFYGMEVGKVIDIYLNTENGHIMVDFDVKSGVSVPHNAEAVAYVPNMLYSARLEIRFQPEGSNEFLENGDIIPGTVGSYILDMKNQLDPYAKKADSMVLALFPTKDSIRQVIGSVEASISQFYRGSTLLSKTLKGNEKEISISLLKLENLSADYAKNEAYINETVLKLTKASSEFSKTDYVSTLSKLHPDSIKIPDISQNSRKISVLSNKMMAINNGADTSLYKIVHDKKLKEKVTGTTDSLHIKVRNLREHPEEKINIKKKK